MGLEPTYEDAVRNGTVTELPAIAEATAPPWQPPDGTYATLLAEADRQAGRPLPPHVASGHWVDNDPPGCPR
ncbi:MAG TPA: hypothetical protein VIS06_09695 [Mycobacteriales bacterium]